MDQLATDQRLLMRMPTARRNGALMACHRIALVLQGGGALGAYQAGVYQGRRTKPAWSRIWVCGVSIGAINSAIIAGNPPAQRLEKLQTFWDRITARKVWHYTPDGDIYRKARNLTSLVP